MKDFISEIKKIPTDGLIYCLSEKSIDMFIKNHKVIFDYLFKSSYMPV